MFYTKSPGDSCRLSLKSVYCSSSDVIKVAKVTF